MLYQTDNPHGGSTEAQIWLDYSANTNPFGTPQAILDAMVSAMGQVHRYPDPCCRELVAAIAAFEQVAPEDILCGNGAAELIYSYCAASGIGLGLELAPTFSEYRLALEAHGGQMVCYPLRQAQGFALENDFLPFLEQQRPHGVFLCNPNNPTGSLIGPELLQEMIGYCHGQGILVFLDECFLDFTQEGISMKHLLARYPNLLILKAFTKSYGMAGVRLGYCLSANHALLRAMSRTVQPWNVSALAQAAGVAALQQQSFLQHTRAVVAAERSWLQQQLRALGLWVSDGRANYLLFQGPAGLDGALKQQGIAIRSCANYHGLGPGWYRIAVRLHEENQRLMEAIRQALGRED